MSIRYDPPRPLPPGQRHSYDVTREIEQAERLKATGWHYAFEPDAEEVADKSSAFYGGAELIVREIVTGGPRRWTLFERAASEPAQAARPAQTKGDRSEPV